MITLIPIAMVTVTKDDIYAPSRVQLSKTITEDEFIETYADHPASVKISFEPDGKSNPQLITTYGSYIVGKIAS